MTSSLRRLPVCWNGLLQHLEPVDDDVRNRRLPRESLEYEESSVAGDAQLFQRVAPRGRHIDEDLRTRALEGRTGAYLDHVHMRTIRAQAAVKEFSAVGRPSWRAAAAG